ncbi:MAG TPA: MFS transporter [Nevskiaceae bacterium]|nr:MFS transporter [Nevskiaceae bacterium]
MTSLDPHRRWLALYVLCAGVLMIVLDTTIVTVALPSIRADLRFTETSLVWVVNAYMLTYGGFLLLGGRLGDLYGHRRLFLAGLVLFTAASLACGLSTAQIPLIAARAAQGVGGAVVTAVALSLIMDLFTADADRAKAMAIYGFTCSGGGALGALLGGVLTSAVNWHAIFLVNIPIGTAAYFACLRMIPRDRVDARATRLDVAGAITITVSLLLAVYAVVNGNEAGWTSGETLSLFGGAIALLVAFIAIESRVAQPLVPLAMFRLRNIIVANIVGVLWAAGMFAWFFISALYLQLVLGYDPFQVGIAFVPSDLVMAAFSVSWSAKIVTRFGLRAPAAAGLLIAGAGLALFARAPVDGGYWLDVFPGMILLGIGAGVAFNPVLLAAMSDVEQKDSGLASGIVNTSFMMGGSLGLAVLAAIAAARTGPSLNAETLTAGYHLAFVVGAIFVAVAAALCYLIRQRTPAAPSTSSVNPAPSERPMTESFMKANV